VKNIMPEDYDTSWDLIKSQEGCLPIDEDAYERKYLEWKTRDWPLWLKDNLIWTLTRSSHNQ
jgi:hypothetical protein